MDTASVPGDRSIASPAEGDLASLAIVNGETGNLPAGEDTTVGVPRWSMRVTSPAAVELALRSTRRILSARVDSLTIVGEVFRLYLRRVCLSRRPER